MQMPYWLLKRLPLFEYICPKCRKIVHKGSQICVHCGESYGIAVRVPPTILKDKERLEEYVHKHIFPRVSKLQRDYLAQYFTEIFSDGFESNDFSAWSGTTSSGSNTQTVVSDDKHHGTYSAKFTDPSGNQSFAYRTLSPEGTDVYMRAYVRFSSPTTTDTDDTFAIEMYDISSNWLTLMGVEYVSATGKYHWILYNRNDTTTVISRSDADFTLDTNAWYCLEVHLVISNTVGEVQLWVNGSSIYHVTGQDTDSYGDIYRCCVGLNHRGGDTIYADCVVVADAYIGVEAAGGLSIPVAMHHYNRINKIIRG